MEALRTKIDSQFKDIKGEMKELRDGCNSYRGPHPSSKYDDNLIGGPKEEEANYAYEGYQGNYYGRSSGNWRDINHEMTTETPNLVKTTLPFHQHLKRYLMSPTLTNPCESSCGKTYDPPVNLNAKTTIIHDDSEDEADEAEKEVESSSSKQTKTNPPLSRHINQKGLIT
uniref:Reverse transcriptase domain-containing protein n=1 Tax=Tanacetum cinerariifolium TaxID=118510 RepID=A0A6L2NCY2_TANCI|nr:reverse transcriptase domain-containing protein [Tanacetum cinerariifolium]